MLIEQTLDKLSAMRMHGMARALREQLDDEENYRELTFDERVGMLVDREWTEREARSLTRRLQLARLRERGACIEDIDYRHPRGLDRQLVRRLVGGEWVAKHHNLVITGPTGVGKTYLCCALAQQACRKGYRVLYRRVSRLFDALRLARADGSYAVVLARLARVDLLVIDDYALTPVGDAERRDLLEIMEDRYGNRLTILASQLPIDQWHDHVGDPTIADAICDRLLHNAHRVVLQGPSQRDPEVMKK